MLADLGKFFFALSAIGAGVYGFVTAGADLWTLFVVAVGLLVLISIFRPALNAAARALAVLIGALALLALVLLLIAGNAGGSFHLSQSSETIAVLLLVVGLQGLAGLMWPQRAQPPD